MGNLGPWEILIIAGVIILLFGARKMPEMARSLGKSARILKAETKGMRADEDEAKDKPAEQVTAAPAPKAEIEQLREQLEAAELREKVAAAEARAKAAEAEAKASTDASPIENAQANKNVG